MGTSIVSTSRGVMTGHDARARRRRRRGRGAGLVSGRMSRIGRQPIPVPSGVDGLDRARARAREGPEGRARRAHPARHRRRAGGRAARRHAPDRPRRASRAARAHPLAGREHGRRASPAATRSAWRSRASATARSSRARTSSWPSATRTRSRIHAPDGHRVRGSAAHAHRRQGHLQAARRRDRRDHPQAAPAGALQGQGHPLRGRVRGPEGRQAAHERRSPSRAPRLKRRRRVRAKVRGTAERPRLSVFRSNRGIYAQLIDDVQRPHARRRQLDRGRPQARWQRSSRPKRAGELLAERAKAAGVESACSIAAATATTAASGLWPRAPARAGSPF